MPPTSGVVWRGASVVIVVSPAQLARRLLDRLHDVHVARAAAEVAADPRPDLLLVGLRVLLQEPGRLHDHARRTEAALETVLVPERLLERVQRGAVGHALDG